MKFEDLKKDSFIKWKGIRIFNEWNTFGKVINLTEDEVTILTYDDFKETTLFKGGDAVRQEIDLITKNEFEDLIKISISELNLSKIETKANYKKNKIEAEIKYKKKLESIDEIVNALKAL